MTLGCLGPGISASITSKIRSTGGSSIPSSDMKSIVQSSISEARNWNGEIVVNKCQPRTLFSSSPSARRTFTLPASVELHKSHWRDSPRAPSSHTSSHTLPGAGRVSKGPRLGNVFSRDANRFPPPSALVVRPQPHSRPCGPNFGRGRVA